MDIDWGRTKVAFGPNLGININLQGREPNGIVSPGQEYERLCETLQRDLESYIDPETDERIVEKVVRREEVYTGNAVELAPDLRLIMAKSSVYRGQYAYSPKVNASQSLGCPDKVYGNHAEYGILLACGTSIRAGLQLNGIQIIDVAPTIMRAMGLPIPKNMDGRALKEIFDSSFMPPQDQGGNSSISRASPANGTPVFSEADEQEVLSRLRDLGYLD
jgi:predicted AlkP superfamily phosphohydrolase/phosphomutase